MIVLCCFIQSFYQINQILIWIKPDGGFGSKWGKLPSVSYERKMNAFAEKKRMLISSKKRVIGSRKMLQNQSGLV